MKEMFPNSGLSPVEERDVAAAKAEVTGESAEKKETESAAEVVDRLLIETEVVDTDADGELLSEEFVRGLKMWRLLKTFESQVGPEGSFDSALEDQVEELSVRFHNLTQNEMPQSQYIKFQVARMRDDQARIMRESAS